MDALAQAAGYSRASSIQRYLSEDEFRTEFLPLPAARKFAKALAGRGDPPITKAEVMALAGPEVAAQGSRYVPEIDFAVAGGWGDVTDPYPRGEGTVMIPVISDVGPRAFALRVSGRSMEPLYFNGNHIIVDPDVQPIPGDDVVAKLEGEDKATFKRYRQKTPKEVELFPLNDVHETLTLNAKNPGRIVGVMVEHHRYRRAR